MRDYLFEQLRKTLYKETFSFSIDCSISSLSIVTYCSALPILSWSSPFFESYGWSSVVTFFLLLGFAVFSDEIFGW